MRCGVPKKTTKTSSALVAALAVVLVSTGCVDDYEPRVICHNSNCQEPANPEDDSTMETLEASLELIDEETGRPPIDGMEIDTFWWGAQQRCLVAHDLDRAGEDEEDPEWAVDATYAVEMINDVLAARADAGEALTRHADEFTLLIELKGHVEASKDAAHSPEQLRAHADCGIELGEMAMESADEHGYDVEVIFMSFSPQLLEAIVDGDDFSALQESDHRVRLSALQGLPRPLDTQTESLDEYGDDIGIDMISVHPKWTRDTDRQAIASRDWELSYWSFNLVPEIFDSIKSHQPTYVTTSQAPSFAAWLRHQN